MYIFTTLDLNAKMMEATRELRCAYCGPNDGSVKIIEPGGEFYWIEGRRSYSHFGKGFIPYNKYRECRRKGISPEDYFEIITHYQMCPGCFKKLRKFFHMGEYSGVKDGKMIFQTSFHMTYPKAKYSYDCICCDGNINKGDNYVRRGNASGINTVCVYCYRTLKHIIE